MIAPRLSTNHPRMMTDNPVPQDLAGAVLSIDLAALQSNYKFLARNADAAECGAAVKGNAYGLGLAPVSQALWDAGCRTYFVARPKEGEELRGVLPEATIYVAFVAQKKQCQFIQGHAAPVTDRL